MGTPRRISASTRSASAQTRCESSAASSRRSKRKKTGQRSQTFDGPLHTEQTRGRQTSLSLSRGCNAADAALHMPPASLQHQRQSLLALLYTHVKVTLCVRARAVLAAISLFWCPWWKSRCPSPAG